MVTPYQAQVSLISETLRAIYPEMTIGSVDGLQGQEREVSRSIVVCCMIGGVSLSRRSARPKKSTSHCPLPLSDSPPIPTPACSSAWRSKHLLRPGYNPLARTIQPEIRGRFLVRIPPPQCRYDESSAPALYRWGFRYGLKGVYIFERLDGMAGGRGGCEVRRGRDLVTSWARGGAVGRASIRRAWAVWA